MPRELNSSAADEDHGEQAYGAGPSQRQREGDWGSPPPRRYRDQGYDDQDSREQRRRRQYDAKRSRDSFNQTEGDNDLDDPNTRHRHHARGTAYGYRDSDRRPDSGRYARRELLRLRHDTGSRAEGRKSGETAATPNNGDRQPRPEEMGWEHRESTASPSAERSNEHAGTKGCCRTRIRKEADTVQAQRCRSGDSQQKGSSDRDDRYGRHGQRARGSAYGYRDRERGQDPGRYERRELPRLRYDSDRRVSQHRDVSQERENHRGHSGDRRPSTAEVRGEDTDSDERPTGGSADARPRHHGLRHDQDSPTGNKRRGPSVSIDR
jgi:hypothetical protein